VRHLEAVFSRTSREWNAWRREGAGNEQETEAKGSPFRECQRKPPVPPTIARSAGAWTNR
jgi:hypothetical protein